MACQIQCGSRLKNKTIYTQCEVTFSMSMEISEEFETFIPLAMLLRFHVSLPETSTPDLAGTGWNNPNLVCLANAQEPNSGTTFRTPETSLVFHLYSNIVDLQLLSFPLGLADQ